MAKQPDFSAVAESLSKSVVASPRHVRRLRSSTFWAAFRIGRRTDSLVLSVKEILVAHKLIVKLPTDLAFGKEPPKTWIAIAYIEHPLSQLSLETKKPGTSIAVPDTEWFERLALQQFASEREVEVRFILPILQQLGYKDEDIAIGYPVVMYEGVRKLNKIADVVVFNGSDHTQANALFVVEAKKNRAVPISKDSAGQAKGYAMWLPTPYYVVTNGADIRVWLQRGALEEVVAVDIPKNELKSKWADLYMRLNKSAVSKYKSRIADTLAALASAA